MSNLDSKTQFVRLLTRAVIVATVAVVVLGVWRTVARPDVGATGVRPGDTLSVQDLGVATSPRTVLVFVNSTCRFCTESMPFYRRLVDLGKAPVVVIGYQPTEVLRAYVNSHGLFPDEVVSVTPATLAVSGTPTVMVVDSGRRVVAVWKGVLRARESEVEASLS